ncbi:MAG: kinase-like domain-containing protein [Benjaminiella poitrasii]|nr:MAG: kinase-like domain-containing protein [Benjaminiella poitrasii]
MNNTSNHPHQRAYSVMAVPSELEQHRHNKYNRQANNNYNSNTNSLVPWHIEVYKKYGYEPKLKNPSYFGPYLLLQTLGEGEFAKVKAGVHVQTNQEVAIKLMRKDHIKQASLEIKLEREISVLKTVRHPYIVKLFEVLTIKNYIGIVLQRAAGGELFDYILKHHYLQENEAKRLFAQLISGVDYMHQKHIVHRDLKLENLLLSKDRDVIITDFGFANRFSVAKEDLMATSCGSPCYAAPELVINNNTNNSNNNKDNSDDEEEGTNYVGTAADIWSCGVILFAMLCGYLPFDDDPTNPQGANINALYKYIISTPLEIPKTMSIDATHLLRRMLVPDPTKRCTMDEIKRHPWLSNHRELLAKSVAQLENEYDHHDCVAVVPDNDHPLRLDTSVYQVRQVPHHATIVPVLNHRDTQTTVVTSNINQENREIQQSLVCATTTTSTSLPKNNPSLDISSLPTTISASTTVTETATSTVNNTTATATPVKQVKTPLVTNQQQQTSNNTSSNSFLQEKFFSTLYQRYLASTTTTQQQHHHHTPSATNRRSLQQPIFNNSISKIPNRSQSVQQPQKPPPRRQRMASENDTTATTATVTVVDHDPRSSVRPSLHILPSVSEQSTVASDSNKTSKSKGQKIIDWFKRSTKPTSQSTKFPTSSMKRTQADQQQQQQQLRPLSVLPNPVRAMSIGKPFGSYAADFNDSKLRIHRGAVDQDALTSRAPNEVLQSIKESLTMMGIEMKRCHDYKIKCIRPARLEIQQSQQQQRMRKISTVVVPPFRSFFSTEYKSPATQKAKATTATVTQNESVLYGEQGIDTGDEVQFNIELSKIENLPGLYVVDIRRSRGNVWAFKFLYHTLLDLLNLSNKGQGGIGYMAHRRLDRQSKIAANQELESEESQHHRVSYMTSSSGSSIMIFDEK